MENVAISSQLSPPREGAQLDSILGEITPLRLSFDRKTPESVYLSEEMKAYLSRPHYLSTKQVPTATALRKAYNFSVKKQHAVLIDLDFPLDLKEAPYHRRKEGEMRYAHSAISSTMKASLAELLEGNRKENEGADDESADSYSEGEETSEPEEVKVDPSLEGIHIKYEDPWKLFRLVALCQVKGLPTPDITVWSGDSTRIQDQVRPHYFGPSFDGNWRKPIRFSQVTDLEAKMYFVINHTFWGRKLHQMSRPEPRPGSPRFGIKSIYDSAERKWSQTLLKRVKALLAGKPDPLWSKRRQKAYFLDPNALRNRKSRSLRLIEVLKTIDGIFNQRYLSYPEEMWSWERYDLFVIHNLSTLIGDEFLDGELTESALTLKTKYETLKGLRKLFKEAAHKRQLDSLDTTEIVKGEFAYFVPMWKEAAKATGFRYLYLIGLLCQTRGCGTPPNLVILQSKKKFLLTIQEPVEPLGINQVGLIDAALETLLKSIPDEVFTGLTTKGRISVTAAACLEATRSEGGTISVISELVYKGSLGEGVAIRDFNTGSVTEMVCIPYVTEGEYIFWSCLNKVLVMGRDELTSAYLTIVKEPGKARCVTKASAYLKIVLDFVNKICSHPFSKGVESSQSGMGASHHGWNFFKSFFQDMNKDLFFKRETYEEEKFEGYSVLTETFKSVYVASTDYTTATDFLNHELARKCGVAWMRKCGIPKLLIGIVSVTCYNPRTIYFTATGPFKQIGHPTGTKDVNKVTLVRGVLMGDPLTKIVLHMVNVICRIIAERGGDVAFLSQTFTNPHTIAEIVNKSRSTPFQAGIRSPTSLRSYPKVVAHGGV